MFKVYQEQDKTTLDFEQFTKAVEALPRVLPQLGQDPFRDREAEFLDENVLCNCLQQCNLTIRDLVVSSYKRLDD